MELPIPFQMSMLKNSAYADNHRDGGIMRISTGEIAFEDDDNVRHWVEFLHRVYIPHKQC